MHRGEHVELVDRAREHPLEGRNLQHGVETPGDLLARLAEGAAIEELILEEGAGGRVEAIDVLGEKRLVGRLHQLAEGVDGRAGDGEHQARDVGEGGALLGGELARQRAEDVVEQLDDAGFDLLADSALVALQARGLDVEHVEGGGVVVLGIDDDETIRVLEQRQALDLPEHVALAVDDDQRRRVFLLKVVQDDVLQGLGLAVAGAGDQVPMLHPRLLRNVKGQLGGEEIFERRVVKIGRHDLVGRAAVVGRPEELRRSGVLRGDARD